MSQVFDFLFAQYATYDPIDIGLEIIGVVFGLLSVWLAKKNHIGVFPTGMISTFVYVYLLFQWGLIGDMMINAYYFAVSIYGWYIWTRVNDQKEQTHISSMSTTEWRNIASGISYSIQQRFPHAIAKSKGLKTTHYYTVGDDQSNENR